MASGQMVPSMGHSLALGADGIYWASTGKNDGNTDGAVMARPK